MFRSFFSLSYFFVMFFVEAPERCGSTAAQLAAGCRFLALPPLGASGGGKLQQASAGGVATLPFCAAAACNCIRTHYFQYAYVFVSRWLGYGVAAVLIFG